VPISSVPDHVAAAVPSIDDAARRWRDELGGRWVGPRYAVDQAGFATRQLRFAGTVGPGGNMGGAKLELLEPTTSDGFAARFLERFGARIHHVTLKVPALLPAIETLRDDGFDVVDVFAEGDVWHEGFLRPSQVGGLIVQIAWSGRSDDEWAAMAGIEPERPAADGPRLLGPTLAHPDPAAVADVWQRLGAEVEGDDAGLRVAWPGAPLNIEVVPGPEAGPVGLRFVGTDPHPGDGRVGPPTLPVARVS
jgi:methylmalonyl-CoA/ethylmalonyl-CoA epimerase